MDILAQQTTHGMLQVTAVLTTIVEGVVGATIDPHTPMMSAGLDSLAAVELRNTVQQRFSVSLSATAAFDYPTIHVRRSMPMNSLTCPAAGACCMVFVTCICSVDRKQASTKSGKNSCLRSFAQL